MQPGFLQFSFFQFKYSEVFFILPLISRCLCIFLKSRGLLQIFSITELQCISNQIFFFCHTLRRPKIAGNTPRIFIPCICVKTFWYWYFLTFFSWFSVWDMPSPVVTQWTNIELLLLSQLPLLVSHKQLIHEH